MCSSVENILLPCSKLIMEFFSFVFFLTLLYKQILYSIIILHRKILVGFFVTCVMSQMLSLGLSFCVILCSYGSLLISNEIPMGLMSWPKMISDIWFLLFIRTCPERFFVGINNASWNYLGFLSDNSWENTSYLCFTQIFLCTVLAKTCIALLRSIKLRPSSKTNHFIWDLLLLHVFRHK